MLLKPTLRKESKYGFKTINYRHSPVLFFKKNCFRHHKIIKQIGCFVVFFYFFDNIDAQIRPDLKNLSAGLLESVKVLPKC